MTRQELNTMNLYCAFEILSNEAKQFLDEFKRHNPKMETAAELSETLDDESVEKCLKRLFATMKFIDQLTDGICLSDEEYFDIDEEGGDDDSATD